MSRVRALLDRLPTSLREFLLYGLSSALALGLDWSLLVGLTAAGLNYLVAAAIGFCSGMVVTYGLSVAVVFRHRRLTSRWQELAAFIGIGLAGLALTQVLLALWVEVFGMTPGLAKIPTAGLVFLFNFGVRRALLFRAAGSLAP
jgi:hypothetical protein